MHIIITGVLGRGVNKMSNTEKQTDKIIADTMRELYDSIEKKEQSLEAELESIPFEETEEVSENVEVEEAEEVEEEMEDAVDEELTEDDDEEEEDEKDHKPLKKKVFKILGIILGVLLVIYAAFAIFFGSHFMFNTTINGKNYSLKSAKAVAEDMKLQVQDYTLTLEESDGDSEEISGKSVSLEYVPTDELAELVSAQNNFLWITSLWDKPELETKVTVQYDDAKLTNVIKNLACMDPENQIESVDAKPEFKETQFEI